MDKWYVSPRETRTPGDLPGPADAILYTIRYRYLESLYVPIRTHYTRSVNAFSIFLSSSLFFFSCSLSFTPRSFWLSLCLILAREDQEAGKSTRCTLPKSRTRSVNLRLRCRPAHTRCFVIERYTVLYTHNQGLPMCTIVTAIATFSSGDG